jgi:hypothetical protein
MRFFLFSLALFLSLAAFSLSPAWALSPQESERVEKFLTLLGQRTDLVFIRNGKEYPVNKAVSHLRRKLKNSADKLTSAEQFLDNVASGSSISGQPYLIRRPGGANEKAGPFFHELLKKADASDNPTPTP